MSISPSHPEPPADDPAHAGHEAAHHHQHGQLGQGPAVLNIGGDVGALVLYTRPEFEGLEIEVAPVEDPSLRTHTEILRRTVRGETFWAGVYSELVEGDYRILLDEPSDRPHAFAIRGGSVTEIDWR